MHLHRTSLFSAPALIILLFSVFLFSCERERSIGESCFPLLSTIAQTQGEDPGEINYETYAGLRVPPLHPDEALERFELEEGFRIEVVAHEPMVVDPVAMDIDPDGRLWVVDMPSYMPVADMSDWETAVREQVPKGRIVILEDTNGDGVTDTKRVFRDGMVLPRSIKVLSDGVLVGEPPNVWYIRDTTGDGKGDSRELVYDQYGDPNVTNVESLPNGLMWGMDNWIHNVDIGASALRQIDGQWQVRPFERLGQWGVTQDDWGHIYSASNPRPLVTHYLPFSYSHRHPMFDLSEGMNISIAPNEPLWPAHAVGTNRSYQIGTEVREDGTLRRATSTLSPVIYRGHQFGDEYLGNAFTPEPAANMIKRMILDNDPGEIEKEAHFAYEEKEFLTSTDERFRPVNMYNSPDGALYVVDMYRGIIQHARFLTDHLRDYALEHDLHMPYGKYGRIYRIVRDDQEIDYNTPKFSQLTPTEITEYLRHRNGHLRDRAQQVLVQCSPSQVVSTLEEMAGNASEEAWTRLQALWTLEGISRSVYGQDQLTQTALQALEDDHPRIRAAAVKILESELAGNSEEVLAAMESLYETETAPYVRIQMLASLGESDSDTSLHLMAALLDAHSDSPYFREMALTGVYEREERFAELLQSEFNWSDDLGEEFEELLAALTEAAEADPEAAIADFTDAQRELYERGSHMYATCMACHGAEGEGASGIGPPLAGSEWVQQDKEVITRILLHGFEGGVAEFPRRAVNITGVMPAHRFLTDEDLAAIMTYMRNTWGNEAGPIEPEEVERIRTETEGRAELWTPEELREMID
jgi:mono/diheme cytochrome c family protein/glucose/arabinose dehydrogenase